MKEERFHFMRRNRPEKNIGGRDAFQRSGGRKGKGKSAEGFFTCSGLELYWKGKKEHLSPR